MKAFYLVITAVIVAGITIGLFVMMAGIFTSNAPYSGGSTGYIEIVPQGFAKAYTAGQKINFSVLIQGFGKYPCLPPEIKIFNDNEKEKPVFYYISQSVSCPSSDEHYVYYFPSQNNT
ncbi:MAG: hypothetical protein KGI27_14640, partial [Thaumarchaeota archaeon]|nr:hypothetical protein [Nitrososphaerota archaeon]